MQVGRLFQGAAAGALHASRSGVPELTCLRAMAAPNGAKAALHVGSQTSAAHSQPLVQRAFLPASAWARLLMALPPLGLGTWVATSEDPAKRANFALQFPLRLARDFAAVSAIAADYEGSLRGLEGLERERVKREVHMRSANRLKELCFLNGGIYIKLGQHIAQLDHLLPEEYVEVMRAHMLDKCPRSPWADVERSLTRELGAPPSTLFAHIDPQPLASASLAQVHRAVAHDGRQLAVKVQHPGLRDTCAADVATVELLVRAVHHLYPSVDYTWLVDEVKLNLPVELDFLREADNNRRCAANLAAADSGVRGRVTVPAVDPALTTPCVLTMEFIDGVPVTDTAGLAALGAQPREVAQLVSQTFNEMIFRHGFVHCDPHAGNLLVRMRGGRPQLVLLDHGLYRQLDDEFRLDYAALWQALILGNLEGIRRYSAAMNAGHATQLFASVLTMRPWDTIVQQQDMDRLNIPRDADDKIREYAQQNVAGISDLLGRIPRPLLLLLKTNDCLRSVDRALGQPVNTFVVTARECTRALAKQRGLERPGVRARLAGWWERGRVEGRILGARAVLWARHACSALWPWPRRRPAAAAPA